MKIKKSNICARLIQATFKGNRPKSLCSFFWQTVFALLVLPISFLGLLLRLIIGKDNYYGSLPETVLSTDYYVEGERRYFTSGLKVLAGYIILLILGTAAGIEVVPEGMWLHIEESGDLDILYKGLILGIATVIAIVIAVTSIVFILKGIIYLYAEYKTSRRKNQSILHKEKEPNILVEFIKAKKSKVCPMIEYVDDEK